MDEKPADTNPPELRVLMDAKFEVGGLRSDADQPKLESALKGTVGTSELSFLEGRVSIRYDPEQVTEGALREKIRQAGFQIKEVQTAPAAPPINPPDENR